MPVCFRYGIRIRCTIIVHDILYIHIHPYFISFSILRYIYSHDCEMSRHFISEEAKRLKWSSFNLYSTYGFGSELSHQKWIHTELPNMFCPKRVRMKTTTIEMGYKSISIMYHDRNVVFISITPFTILVVNPQP